MAAPNAQFAEIGKAFAQHYYQTFDTNRAALHSLYQNESMLTFENEQFMGMQAIMTKLTEASEDVDLHARCPNSASTLQFQTVAHQTSTIDCQPSPGNGIMVFVTGNLAVDNNTTTPLKFAQTFMLMPTPSGSWYIHNDMFRLNYC